MTFKIANFVLLVSFSLSFIGIIFGGSALNGNRWLTGRLNEQTSSIALSQHFKNFIALGFAFEIVAGLLIFLLLIISIFYDEVAQKWNIYITGFLTVITLSLLSFFVMAITIFKFMAETDNMQLNLFRATSFIYFIINNFCKIMAIGMIFYILGFLSKGDNVNRENVESQDNDQLVDTLYPCRGADFIKKITDQPLPSGTPAPNITTVTANLNNMKNNNSGRSNFY